MNADPEEDSTWAEWLVNHGYYEKEAYEQDSQLVPKNTAVHETVPLPSSGVFAEAVLGRFNSAEKLDMTRFWNWQDSPIPFAAPEIAALQAGGKAQNITPGTDGLETPIIQQMAPSNLPDPQGLSAIINALTSANMFRDMSGLAQTAALAQAALNAATVADTAAGKQAGENMATAGKYQVEMAKAIMPLLTMAAGSAMGVPMPPMGGQPGKPNISNAGAIQNEAAKLDAKKKNGGDNFINNSLLEKAIQQSINPGPLKFDLNDLFNSILAIDSGGSEPAAEISEAEAFENRLNENGITLHSSGNCRDQNNGTCTSLEGIREETIAGIIAFREAVEVDLVITGGTEVGHAAGEHSHANGYKVDIRLDDTVNTYIETNYEFIGQRSSDNADQYQDDDGNIFARESNHWDIIFF